jgi:uncharacterized protein
MQGLYIENQDNEGLAFVSMITVFPAFHEQLQVFLRKDLRGAMLSKSLEHRTTVKDIIESFGVPHTEVDIITVNGKSCDFSCHVEDCDRICVYPFLANSDIQEAQHLQERVLPRAKFVADVHLGKMARKMRILGLDVSYRNDYSDEELVAVNRNEGRVLLTRDRYLLMHNSVRCGYFVKSSDHLEQVMEVIRRYRLLDELKPFTRCASCNGELHGVTKEEIDAELEPKTRLYFQRFARCAGCGKIFWEGSHFHRLNELIRRLSETCAS